MSRLRRQLLERAHRKGESHENRERWLLTYADMITLLLGLFIIMYSISQVDQAKLKQVADVIRGGFGLGESFFQGRAITIEDDPMLQPKTQLYRFWERISYTLKRLKEKPNSILESKKPKRSKLYYSVPLWEKVDSNRTKRWFLHFRKYPNCLPRWTWISFLKFKFLTEMKPPKKVLETSGNITHIAQN